MTPASTISDSQVDRALAVFPETAPKQDADTPQTPFPTSLELTREQEELLVEHVLNRCETLESESGRIIQPQGTTPSPDPYTWMGRREMWTLRYYNHVEDRKKVGTIFEHSNLTASLSQRITMQMVARANAYFFPTDPWFSIKPINHDGDTALEERIERHAHWKFNANHLVRTLESANEFAFVRGETVTKTTYDVQAQRYKRRGNALHSGGTLVADEEGNPILDDAVWQPEMVPNPALAMLPPPGAPGVPGQQIPGQPPGQAAPGQPVPGQGPMPGPAPTPEQGGMPGAEAMPPAALAPAPLPPPLPEMVPTGQMVLKSDNVTLLPKDAEWKPGLWPFHVVVSEGARCEIVYFKDFLCPLDVPSVHEADINIHLYSLPVMRIVEMFRREDLAKAGVKDLESMRRAVAMVRAMSSGTEPTSGASQPRGDHGEQGNTAPTNSPNVDLVEAWVRFDVDGDGVQEEVMVVVDRVNRFPVYYDYTANLTIKGRRPFEVIRSRAVDGRWYGIGSMEYFEPEQEFIDLTINRRNFRMSQAGRITWFNPHVTKKGRSQPGSATLEFGKTYELLDGYKGEDLAGYIELPDDSENLMEMLNFYMQLMQLKSGVINAGDQEASGLPSSNTATGINDVAQSGREMFSQYLNCLLVGQEDTLIANTRVTYRNMNKTEIFRFFQGDTAGLDQLTPEEVNHLEFIVSIRLTRQHTEKVLQTSAQASSLVDGFYKKPPLIQEKVKEFYRDSISALGYNNAKKTIEPVPVMALTPGDPNAQGAMGGSQAAANTGAPAAPEPPAPPQPII